MRMECKEDFLSDRKKIQVVDATLRDGGLVNNFYFTDTFVRDLYHMNLAAGTDYMEFGYKASQKLFDRSKFGKWKFCRDEDIYDIVGENHTNLKIAVMADVGRCDYQEDLRKKSESPINLVRVATYIDTIPEAIQMIEDAANKGYETTCNLMAISKCQESDIKNAMEMLVKSPVDILYIVDSFGSLYPKQIRSMVQLYQEIADKYGKKIGIHAHNNQQCGFANTIEAFSAGASYLDATVSGLGRGAGNCSMEGLLGYLVDTKYQLSPILKFIEKQILPLKKGGLVWGYDIPYLLTGLTDQHPRSAIAAIQEQNQGYQKFYRSLLG